MKRVKAACICQTLQFMPKEGTADDCSAALVKEEVANYKANLDKSHTIYRIIEETEQPDGSILIKIKKQYSQCDVGDYLN